MIEGLDEPLDFGPVEEVALPDPIVKIDIDDTDIINELQHKFGAPDTRNYDMYNDFVPHKITVAIFKKMGCLDIKKLVQHGYLKLIRD